jgi:hypothetical protein
VRLDLAVERFEGFDDPAREFARAVRRNDGLRKEWRQAYGGEPPTWAPSHKPDEAEEIEVRKSGREPLELRHPPDDAVSAGCCILAHDGGTRAGRIGDRLSSRGVAPVDRPPSRSRASRD